MPSLLEALKAVSYPDNLVIEYWQQAGLLKPSVVKPIVATLQTNLLLRQLGTLVVSDQQFSLWRQLVSAGTSSSSPSIMKVSKWSQLSKQT